jgi:hypothetical protein
MNFNFNIPFIALLSMAWDISFFYNLMSSEDPVSSRGTSPPNGEKRSPTDM